MKNICYIIGAGDFCETSLPVYGGDFIIAADGGYEHLKTLGLSPDILIGDFDSLSAMPEHENIVRLPKEKDDTDMLAAINTGLDRGFKLFHIYGGTGGRIEHTIANIQILSYLLRHNARGFLFSHENIITMLKNDTVCFSETCRGYVSVFAYSGQASGVSIKGLRYELENVTVSDTVPIGVSNEFIGKPGEISVKDGTILIVYPRI